MVWLLGRSPAPVSTCSSCTHFFSWLRACVFLRTASFACPVVVQAGAVLQQCQIKSGNVQRQIGLLGNELQTPQTNHQITVMSVKNASKLSKKWRKNQHAAELLPTTVVSAKSSCFYLIDSSAQFPFPTPARVVQFLTLRCQLGRR